MTRRIDALGLSWKYISNNERNNVNVNRGRGSISDSPGINYVRVAICRLSTRIMWKKQVGFVVNMRSLYHRQLDSFVDRYSPRI